MTPEGKVKEKIRELLDKYGVYYFMPVQMGFGQAGLDYHCCVNDHSACGAVAFFIEAKRPGKSPTARQEELISKLRKQYNATVFVINNEVTLRELENWLKVYKDSIYERTRASTLDSGIPVSE